MSFVFYDTETTGLSTDFDQILQFAAIRTDADLNETGRINVRSRLQPHVVPHPEALRVNGMRISDLVDPSVPSHYEMMRQVRQTLLEWSPAIFVGYNSLNFDEHLLRQALFQTLHPPYLSNTAGNCRTDAMHLVQAASVFAPDCIEIPKDIRGKSVFRLADVSSKNGALNHQAHDALGDVLATIHLAKCIRENAPECWNRFVRFSKKASVADFIEGEDAFVLTEFYYGRPFHYVIAALGKDPTQDNVTLCLDLRVDLEWLTPLSDEQLVDFVRQSPKPVRRIRTNAAPMIAALDEMPPHAMGTLSISEITSRSNKLKADKNLQTRLISAVAEAKAERPISPYVEERLYDTFVGRDDEQRMADFHLSDWPARVQIVDSFIDERLRYFGRRLIHTHRPDLLKPEHHAEVTQIIRSRLMDHTVPDGKWLSLPTALKSTEDLLHSVTGPTHQRLSEYRDYLLNALATPIPIS